MIKRQKCLRAPAAGAGPPRAAQAGGRHPGRRGPGGPSRAQRRPCDLPGRPGRAPGELARSRGRDEVIAASRRAGSAPPPPGPAAGTAGRSWRCTRRAPRCGRATSAATTAGRPTRGMADRLPRDRNVRLLAVPGLISGHGQPCGAPEQATGRSARHPLSQAAAGPPPSPAPRRRRPRYPALSAATTSHRRRASRPVRPRRSAPAPGRQDLHTPTGGAVKSRKNRRLRLAVRSSTPQSLDEHASPLTHN